MSIHLRRRLNPFLHANCRSVQLLKILGDLEEQGDCVVWSESLKLEAGRELYICCTTKRIVCFEVLKDDHGSSFTSNLAWSVSFPPREDLVGSPIRAARQLLQVKRTVALKLVNAGHNGVALYILDGPDDKINDKGRVDRASTMGFNQPHQQFSQFGKDEDTVNIFQKMGLGPVDDRGKDEEKGGLGASSFLRSGAGGSRRGEDKDIKVCVVKAEFQHRQALLRIANVAHCLMECWEEVDEDEMGVGGDGAWR